MPVSKRALRAFNSQTLGPPVRGHTYPGPYSDFDLSPLSTLEKNALRLNRYQRGLIRGVPRNRIADFRGR